MSTDRYAACGWPSPPIPESIDRTNEGCPVKDINGTVIGKAVNFRTTDRGTMCDVMIDNWSTPSEMANPSVGKSLLEAAEVIRKSVETDQSDLEIAVPLDRIPEALRILERTAPNDPQIPMLRRLMADMQSDSVDDDNEKPTIIECP